MIAYIEEEIIKPYITNVRERLGMEDQAIFDHFRGQLTPKVVECLESSNIQSVLVPACCTDRLQPLDISVNKAAKTFFRSEFQAWYAGQVQQQFSDEEAISEPVDLSWLVRLHEYLSSNPNIIVNGFMSAGIPQSIDAGKPILSHPQGSNSSESVETDSEYDYEDEDEDVDEDSEDDFDEEDAY